MFSTLFWKFWGKSWDRSLWLLAHLWKIHRSAKSQSDRSQLFPQNFQNNVENMFLHVLSVFEIDFHHLNTFSDVFLVGQSLVILSVFYVFPPLLHTLVNCPFLKKRQNRYPPTIDPIFALISPPPRYNFVQITSSSSREFRS